MDCAPPIGTMEMPSASRSRPRRSASASMARWSLMPSTSTTAREAVADLLNLTLVHGVYVRSPLDESAAEASRLTENRATCPRPAARARRVSVLRIVRSTSTGAAREDARQPGSLGAGMPGSALAAAAADRHPLGIRRKEHTGQLVVNGNWAKPLASVFRKLHELRFPIRHMGLDDMYGPRRAFPADGDVTGSFSCRRAVPSPLHGWDGEQELVEPRVRACDRHQPGREPLRRLWSDPRSDERPVHGSLPTPEGDGHSSGRPSLPLDRLGLGRGVVG